MKPRFSCRTIAFLLSTVLTLTSVSPVLAKEESGGLIRPRTSTSDGTAKLKPIVDGKVNMTALKLIAKDYNVPDEFLDEVAHKSSLTLRQFQYYAETYNLPAQFVQRFFTDYFVFQKGEGLEYIPVDPQYKKNNYNFNNLVTTKTGEKKYVVNGQSKALKGIDVSEFQGDIDWEKVKADGVRFAFIRLGYRGYGTGKINIDKKFEQNIRGAAAAGIPIGVYFYSSAINKSEAIEEANTVLQYLNGQKLKYPVVIDMEDPGSSSARTYNLSKQTATDVVAAFCSTIQKAGYRPMIYTNSRWFVSRLDMDRLPYDKWLALYYEMPFFPYDFQIWQYTGKGRVNGIKGNVDMNLCFVNYR